MYKKDEVIWNEVGRWYGVNLGGDRYYNLLDRYELSMKDYELEQSFCKLDNLYTRMLEGYRAKTGYAELIERLLEEYDSGLIRLASRKIREFLEREMIYT